MSPPSWFAALGMGAAAGVVSPDDPEPLALYAGEFSAPPAQQWRVRLPGPVVPSATHTELGGATIDGEYIFVGSAGADKLYVLNRRTGREVLALPAGAPVESTPVVHGGDLIYSDGSGTTWVWPLTGGTFDRPRWTHSGSSPILASPLVTDDFVFIATVSNIVYALDRSTGELVWRHSQRQDASRSSELELYGAPTPALRDDVLLAGFSDGTVVGLTAEKGDLIWQRRVGEGQYPDIMGAVRVRGTDAVVAGYTEPLVALDLVTRNVRWRVDVGGAQAALIGGGGGKTPASFDVASDDGGFVFHGGADGRLRCLSAVSGEEVWLWDSETETALTSPVPTKAGLLVGASGGSLYLIDPTSGEERWRWEPGFHPSGVTLPPAVDGRQAVVVTNAGYVTSFIVPETREGPLSFGAVGWYEEP